MFYLITLLVLLMALVTFRYDLQLAHYNREINSLKGRISEINRQTAVEPRVDWTQIRLSETVLLTDFDQPVTEWPTEVMKKGY